MKRLAAATGIGMVLALTTAGAQTVGWVQPATLNRSDLGSRYRVFATAGDLKLENAEVTAVVRKSDGWLTEFWRNRAILPSIDQLGVTTNVDAIWQFVPSIIQGKSTRPIKVTSVRTEQNAIVTVGAFKSAGASYTATTRFRLKPSGKTLEIHTTLTCVEGDPKGPVAFGDQFKWGNVQYYTDAFRRPRMKYSGPAKWVGRRGAGGDLLLRRVDRKHMQLRYTARFRGFQGAITAQHFKGIVKRGEPRTVARELSFEPLPIAPPTPPKDVGYIAANIVDENGAPLAAKVRIDLAASKRALFDDNGGLSGTDRFMWTGNGRLKRDLRPGVYKLLFTAGIERAAHSARLRVTAGKTQRLDVRLPRVLKTPGWIAADLHLHQVPSVDADISLPTRVVSIAAEGVEFAVATDHYVVTDLAPTVDWMTRAGALTSRIQTMIGSEVSTLGNRFGHFNVFPLLPGDRVKSRSVTVDELFASARKASPTGILQVNHPRWSPAISYFSYFGIDDNTAAMSRTGYNPNYDTIEVYNGLDARDLKKVKRVLLDFAHLLGTGKRYSATGSSDSHNLAFIDPGLPRTMVHYGQAKRDEHDVRADPKAIISAIRAGRSVVTSGPMIRASVDGTGPGGTVATSARSVDLKPTVEAAPWIDTETLRVLVGPRLKPAHTIRLRRSRSVARFSKTLRVPLPVTSTFIIVTVAGAKGLPNVARDYTLPFAFTNPIYIERPAKSKTPSNPKP